VLTGETARPRRWRCPAAARRCRCHGESWKTNAAEGQKWSNCKFRVSFSSTTEEHLKSSNRWWLVVRKQGEGQWWGLASDKCGMACVCVCVCVCACELTAASESEGRPEPEEGCSVESCNWGSWKEKTEHKDITLKTQSELKPSHVDSGRTLKQ